MKHLRWLFLPCLLVVATNLVHGGGKGKDTGKLDGAWVADFDGKKIELTFAKDTFSVKVPDKADNIKGTYKTDLSKKPAHLDMLIKEGDEKNKGKTVMCIFELQGDTLKWCAADPEAGNARPKAFPEKEGPSEGEIYLVFKRAGK